MCTYIYLKYSRVSALYASIYSDNSRSLSNDAMPSAVVLSYPHKLFLWLAEHCFRIWYRRDRFRASKLTSAQYARYVDIFRLPISVLTTSGMCIIWPVVSFKIMSPNSTSWINWGREKKLMKYWTLSIWSFEETGLLSSSWSGLSTMTYFLAESILCFFKPGISNLCVK